MSRIHNTDGARANGTKPPLARVDIASVRREQIVEAAARIITSQGIQNLSLSAIEADTGMSRGQLTYYFKTKEDILLAVFDRMVRRMRERVGTADDPSRGIDPRKDAWEFIQTLMTNIISQPAPNEFTQLQYTFLAQTGHREDFRKRLASLYEEWRVHMSAGLAALIPQPSADARLLATLVQAMIHGLVMQLQADPAAFDRTRILELCLSILSGIVGRPVTPQRNPGKSPSREGSTNV